MKLRRNPLHSAKNACLKFKNLKSRLSVHLYLTIVIKLQYNVHKITMIVITVN